jgi:hypothetical protein
MDSQQIDERLNEATYESQRKRIVLMSRDELQVAAKKSNPMLSSGIIRPRKKMLHARIKHMRVNEN